MATTTPPKPAVIPPKRSPSTFDRTLASARSTMHFSEVIRLAVDSFKASKVRFLLTMLGMVIGSASIILVAALGLTGKQYALDQLTSIGPNKIELQQSDGICGRQASHLSVSGSSPSATANLPPNLNS